jgi:hypothetical protein
MGETLPPLPPGWTEHTAPKGHKYYYNASLKKSTYKRPTEESQISAPPTTNQTPSTQSAPETSRAKDNVVEITEWSSEMAIDIDPTKEEEPTESTQSIMWQKLQDRPKKKYVPNQSLTFQTRNPRSRALASNHHKMATNILL